MCWLNLSKKLATSIGVSIVLLLFMGVGSHTSEDAVPSLKALNKLFGTPDLTTLRILEKANYKEEEVSLGRALFFDKSLSKNKNVSCGSCHKSENGFGDGETFSTGTNGDTLSRHTPSIFNLAWSKNYFWDGRVETLEEQLESVLTSKEELDFSFDSLINRLKKDDHYREIFNSVYGVDRITKKTISRSLIAFETTKLISNKSPFDKYLAGDATALNATELKGLSLFLEEGKCVKCHNGPNFTDNEFHNVGVVTEDLGRQPFDLAGVKKEFEMRPYPFFSTFKAFKTPSLRNVEFTAPYFHNGSEASIKDVILFYNLGGKNTDRTGIAIEISPIGLTGDEVGQIEEFLKTLSSEIEID